MPRKTWNELSPAYRRRLEANGIFEEGYAKDLRIPAWTGDVASAYPLITPGASPDEALAQAQAMAKLAYSSSYGKLQDDGDSLVAPPRPEPTFRESVREALAEEPVYRAPDDESDSEESGDDFPCCDQRFPAALHLPTAFEAGDLYAFNRLIHKLDDAGYTVAAGRMRDIRDIHFDNDGRPCTRPTPGSRMA